jgi:hypothetical protein
MALKFRKLDEIPKNQSNGYDIWEFSNNSGINAGVIGWYFVPADVDGKVYHDALKSAEKKLIDLGLTEIEAKAVIGKQLF